jgi:hypothetical protein
MVSRTHSQISRDLATCLGDLVAVEPWIAPRAHHNQRFRVMSIVEGAQIQYALRRAIYESGPRCASLRR